MDYLGIQGYWVCVIVAVMTLVIGLLSLGSVRHPVQAAVTALILGMLSLFSMWAVSAFEKAAALPPPSFWHLRAGCRHVHANVSDLGGPDD